MKYIVLLRGINVGGHNIIKMADLREALSSEFENVKTYIQSGNVVLDSTKNIESTKNKISKILKNKFKYSGKIMMITSSDLEKIIKKAPKKFGSDPKKYKYDVMFLEKGLKAKDVVDQIEIRDGVDKIYAGNNVVYFSRLTSKLTKSYMPKLIKLDIYKKMTIRNWRTTNKLLELAGDEK